MQVSDEFPIESQTSPKDKIALLQIRELLGSAGGYCYLEIGSFLGGSLAPFSRIRNASALYRLITEDGLNLMKEAPSSTIQASRIS